MEICSASVNGKVYFWVKIDGQFFDSDIFGNKKETLTLLKEVDIDSQAIRIQMNVDQFKVKEPQNDT